MDAIKMWMLQLGAGLAASVALAWAVKKLPDIIAAWVSAQIDKALSAGDDIDDELVIALCRWAEKKAEKEFPNGDAGEKKYQMVAAKLVAMLPLSVRPFVSANTARIAEVIEVNVERLQKELAEKSLPQK